jgi:mannose/fructose/N-acetylgalactosamine-specific phosphotransferase system component IID
VLLVLLIRRGEPADLAVAGLLCGAFIFIITFAIISIACDYRYLVFLDLSAMAATLYLVKKA